MSEGTMTENYCLVFWSVEDELSTYECQGHVVLLNIDGAKSYHVGKQAEGFDYYWKWWVNETGYLADQSVDIAILCPPGKAIDLADFRAAAEKEGIMHERMMPVGQLRHFFAQLGRNVMGEATDADGRTRLKLEDGHDLVACHLDGSGFGAGHIISTPTANSSAPKITAEEYERVLEKRMQERRARWSKTEQRRNED